MSFVGIMVLMTYLGVTWSLRVTGTLEVVADPCANNKMALESVVVFGSPEA